MNSVDMNLSKLQEAAADQGAWGAAVHVVLESDMTLQLHNIKDRGTAFEISAVLQKVETMDCAREYMAPPPTRDC